MLSNFTEIRELAEKIGPQKVAVAVAQDKELLLAIEEATNLRIIEPILIGNASEIRSIAKNHSINIEKYRMIDEKGKIESCRLATQLVCSGEADLIMKGFVDTSLILKTVLDKEINLFNEGDLLSHVGVFSVPGYERLIIISDSAMNISPTMEEKVKLIKNTIVVANAIGINNPKVAMLCPLEKVNKKIPATIDADMIRKMNERGDIKDCIIGGPFALDNAISIEAARHKGINHPVAGYADILITPDLNSGNILNKSMEYFGRAQKAGIIIGAKIPIVLTSRASSVDSKLNSIAVGTLVSRVGGQHLE